MERSKDLVLLVQDITEFDYTAHEVTMGLRFAAVLFVGGIW